MFFSRLFAHPTTPLWAMILVGLTLRINLYTTYPLFWDAASYLLMGRYIFSGGEIGVLEPFRPLAWPMSLGFLWKVGVPQIIAAKILEQLLSLGNIWLLYAIAQKLFNRATAMGATALLILSPTFFLWGNSLYADIPASFVGLLSLYWLMTGRWGLAGAASALAFFTKFPQITSLLPAIALFLTQRSSPQDPPQKRFFLVGAFAITTIFVSFQVFLYGNPWQPFIDGAESYPRFLTKWSTGFAKCLRLLITEENYLLALTPLLLFKTFHSTISKQQWAVLAGGWLSLLWVGKFAVDHHRLTLGALPLLYLGLGHLLAVSHDKLKTSPHRWAYYGWLVLLCLLAGNQLYNIAHMRYPENQLNPIQSYVTKNQNSIVRPLWISNPKLIITSQKLKGDRLLYDPTFNTRKIAELRFHLHEARTILLDSRDLICNPPQDPICEAQKQKLLAEILMNFHQELNLNNPAIGLVAGVFTKTPP